MRLICPNCDAQYEVDAALIPAEGRDVQCSACGHVWFQSPDLADGGEDEAEFAPPPGPAFGGEPEETPEPEPEDPQVLRRHSLDDSMLAVLREEAEREARARAAEAERAAPRSLEMQPELGLDEAPPRLRIRPRAQEPGEPPEAAPAPPPPPVRGARRELLPDIEAINSTLDASSASRRGEAAVQVPEPPERRRAGFRIGFVLMLVLAVLAWLLYTQSPRLAQAVPQAGPVLAGYTALVDKARLGLDSLMQGALNALE